MLTASVVIATRNRPEPLHLTLQTLVAQTVFPLEAIVVDSSDGGDTEAIVSCHAATAQFTIRYVRSMTPSAAGQRNTGIELSLGEIVVFLDDDIELEPEFMKELLQPFLDDVKGEVGGISGTIVNQVYTPPRGLNRFLLGLVMGDASGEWAGRVVGPAVNFLPADKPNTVQRVEWLNTTGTAYRKSALKKYRFGQQFTGYSFAEDLHLSSRVGSEFVLLNTTKARFLHHDMGQRTHTNWTALGESSVVNRYNVLTNVLRRERTADKLRFFLYEVLYGTLAAVASSRLKPARMRQLAAMMLGKLRGFWIIWTCPKENSHA